MRKTRFAVVVGSAVLAVAPAAAIARGHDDGSHHHLRHHRHARVRHEHFGGGNNGTAVGNSAPDAGTVASFNNGVLAIMLNDGSIVRGQVTGATELKCEAAAPPKVTSHEHGDGDRGGRDNNGEDDNGDDQGRGDDQRADQMCSTANLVPGAVVRDAELTISGAGSVWNEVELVAQQM